MTLETALRICLVFGTASVLSIGGGNSVVPQIQLQAVHTYHWLSATQFADVFAISQVAPGPSILIVTLIGYRAAGIAGAILATIAMMAPAGLLVWLLARSWGSARFAALRHAFEHGLAPIAVGLVLASGVVVAHAADTEPAQYLVTAVATLIFCFTRVSPLYVVGAAGLAGWLGWV
jgi:chromate transporter